MGGCEGREAILANAPLPEDPKSYCDYSGPGPWYRCLPDVEMPQRLAPSGPSSKETPCTTLPALLMQIAAGDKCDKDFLLVEREVPKLDEEGKAPPALPRESWTKWSFKQTIQDARTAAMGLIKLGVKEFDSVNIWGFNAPEWHLAAFAANFAAAKLAGLYPTDTPETAAYKVVHSGGAVVVIEDRGKVDKLAKALSARGDATRLKAFVVYGFVPGPNETVDIKGCGAVPLLAWASLLKMGVDLANGEAEVDARVARVRPGHCAALIYTSGTTGDPKAVMISHDNVIFEASMVLSVIRENQGVARNAEPERGVSYLPLSHVAGWTVDIIMPVLITATTPAWVNIFFARPYDLKVGSLKDRLQLARPTIFIGVPLVWDKMSDKLRAIGATTTGPKKKLADWAKGLALEHARNCQLGGSGERLAGHGIASSLILSKVKAAIGLDACKFAFSGAAPIRVDTLEYFGSLDLQINEVYGMSECTGGATWSTDNAHVWGSCGWELPGVEVRVFSIDGKQKRECPRAPNLDSTDEKYQGEICYRGRNIMMGYMAQPDLGQAHVAEVEKKTAEAIDEEGWLHSGDKGMLTDRGMMKITGRYKELIIGNGGENIAPVPIEDHVKQSCDGIAEVMMVGDKRKFNVALVTLKAVGANGEVPGTDLLEGGAKRLNPAVTTISGAMDDPIWIEAVTSAINSANNNGKCCPNNAFKIQKFTILPSNFSEQNNELTPTKKLKRKVVEEAYTAIIDKMYSAEEMYVHY